MYCWSSGVNGATWGVAVHRFGVVALAGAICAAGARLPELQRSAFFSYFHPRPPLDANERWLMCIVIRMPSWRSEPAAPGMFSWGGNGYVTQADG
jgi:hypothetical protein